MGAILWTIMGTLSLYKSHPELNLLNITIADLFVVNNLFFPLLITLLVVKAIQKDTQNGMLKLLYLNTQNLNQIFIAKYIVILLKTMLLFLIELITTTLILKSGISTLMIEIIFNTLIGCSAIILIQMIIMILTNKLTAIISGLAGTLISLVTSGFLPKYINIFIPWEYLSVLNPVKLDNRQYIVVNIMLWIILVIIINLVLMMILKIVLSSKKTWEKLL